MKKKKNTLKATLITGGLLVVLLVGSLVFAMLQKSETTGEAQAQRADSHVLDDAGSGAVTVVEFLDFECEACAGFHPVVDALREKYEGEVTFVVRYFPLAGHVNSANAAIAAEAAAQQGRFEEMYDLLFETQAEWGESRESQPELFRAMAERLGLDMTAYDEATVDPDTAARVAKDFNEGRELGVEGTPSFFVDGEKVTMTQVDDLEKAIEDALQSRKS